MSESIGEKNIRAMIERFWVDFYERPQMLGKASELGSIFFYIDQIEFIVRGGDPNLYWDCSWNNFLIKKKLIIGAADLLEGRLRESEDPYRELKVLRDEYVLWRQECDEWPSEQH